ncbi:TPA: mannonate dehydratase [Enterococcus faecium]|nr:mannonate dehydratase [Enterococcus faecium]HAP6156869.1 mannonate dehydratase [Enterococcus faecium]
MEMTFRWYGANEEKISLQEIRQIPAMKGIVGTLMDIPAGEVWPRERIKSLKDEVEANGLTLKVIESVNVHDDIKIGLQTRDQYIENYKQTIRNLAEFGIEVICYNFMPVFDWVKSDLDYRLDDGSSTLAYISKNIPTDPEEIIRKVENSTNNFELPGWEPHRLSQIKQLLEAYKEVDEEKLRENFAYFLKAIIPTCEEVGIKMAVHPDDPPYSIFGLPRIVKNRDDLDWLCNVVDSPSNGITLCTGSIAERPDNDVYEILSEFCQRDRIPFAHVRNIKYLSDNGLDFYEVPHKSEYGSLDMYKILKTMYDNGFNGYIRPDHGRMIWGETGRPGYGLYDRALGAVYLNGIWEALEKGASK